MANSKERKLCALTAERLAMSLGLSATDETVPDAVDRTSQAVDLSFRIGKVSHFIEHTFIEPFPHATEYGVNFETFANILGAELQRRTITSGRYMLLFNLNPTAGAAKRMHIVLAEKVAVWVEERLTEIHRDIDKAYWTQGHVIESVSTTIGPAAVRLTGRLPSDWNTSAPGQITAARDRPEGLGMLRSERICTALKRKIGKLLSSGRAEDVKTLVLELCDPAISDMKDVISSLRKGTPSLGVWPDHVFVWNTTWPDFWQFCHPIALRSWIDGPEEGWQDIRV